MNIPRAHLYADALFAGATDISFKNEDDGVVLTVKLGDFAKFLRNEEKTFEVLKDALSSMGALWREEKEQKKKHTAFYDTDPDKLSRDDVLELSNKIESLWRDVEDAFRDIKRTLEEAADESSKD